MKTQRAPIQKKVWKSVSRRAQKGIQMRPLGFFGGPRAANLTIFRVPKKSSKKVTKKVTRGNWALPLGSPKETLREEAQGLETGDWRGLEARTGRLEAWTGRLEAWTGRPAGWY